MFASITLVLLAMSLLAGALIPAPSLATYPAPTPEPNHPTACAQNNSVVMIGKSENITGQRALNGSLSKSDLQSDLLYNWSFYDPNLVYILDIYGYDYLWKNEGVFNVTLNVTDMRGNSSLDHMVVTVVPYAYAGPNREFREDSTSTHVPLNATLSKSNGNITSYTWTVFNYEGRNWTLDGNSTYFDFTQPGKYRVMLTIKDDINRDGINGYTSSVNITVTVQRKPTIYEEHWVIFFIGIPLLLIGAAWTSTKYRRDKAIMTPTDVEKAKLQMRNLRKTWKIFRQNRLGFTGFIVLLIFVVMAVFAPVLSTVPQPTLLEHRDDTHDTPQNGIAQWQNPHSPTFSPSPNKGFYHPLGTDHIGQDVYSMTLYGSRASLEVGLIATFISVVLGATIGLGAGYFGRVTDEVLMRVTDFFLVLPWFPLMIVMMAILGQKFIWVVIVIGITSWPSTARIVRAQVLTIKERQFIVRAKAVGAGDMHIIQKHIMPNVMPLIFANTVLLIAIAIFSESFLDFFGLGDSSVISWGLMLESAYESAAFSSGAWWWIGAPGAAIVIMVLSFSLVGYAIDDVLNPKLRKR